jgi:uncharacterized membrane protein
MTATTFLTISSIFAILYGLSFVLAPGQSIAMYGTDPEPHLTLICRFLGSALLAFGVVQWFGKEFRDWDAVRAVLIAIAVLNALNLLVNLWGTSQGLFNAMAWSTTIVSIIFLAGALYCLSAGARKLA